MATNFIIQETTVNTSGYFSIREVAKEVIRRAYYEKKPDVAEKIINGDDKTTYNNLVDKIKELNNLESEAEYIPQTKTSILIPTFDEFQELMPSFPSNGKRETLQIEEAVDKNQQPDIEEILINIFIVDGTGWTKEAVDVLFENAKIIFNKNKVGISFDINNINFIVFNHSSGLELDKFHYYSFKENPTVTIKDTGEIINITKLIGLNIIFTEDILSVSYDTIGIYLSDIGEGIIVIRIKPKPKSSTVAHEIGHALELGDNEKYGNNLMDYKRSDNIYDINISKKQIIKMNNNKKKYLKPSRTDQ